MLTLTLLLLCSAFVVTLLHALGKAPLWVAVLLLAVAMLVGYLPLR